MEQRVYWKHGMVLLGFGLLLLIFARVSFVMTSAYHEGELWTTRPLTDAQRISVAKAKIARALNDPRSAQFGEIFVSRVAGSPAICGTVTSKSGLAKPQASHFVVKDGEIFFNQNDTVTHDMWRVACTE